MRRGHSVWRTQPSPAATPARRTARRSRCRSPPRPTTGSVVGSYPIVPSADGATIANYIVTPTNGTLTIGAWSLKGFYEPVGEMSSIVSAPGAAQPVVSGATVWNAIKGGQTVPMKFNIYRTAGGAQVTTVADAFAGAGFSAYQLPKLLGRLHGGRDCARRPVDWCDGAPLRRHAVHPELENAEGARSRPVLPRGDHREGWLDSDRLLQGEEVAVLTG